jgi:hypothetical protein
MAVGRQWLSSDHMDIPTDANATVALQKRNGVINTFLAEIL